MSISTPAGAVTEVGGPVADPITEIFPRRCALVRLHALARPVLISSPGVARRTHPRQSVRRRPGVRSPPNSIPPPARQYRAAGGGGVDRNRHHLELAGRTHSGTTAFRTIRMGVDQARRRRHRPAARRRLQTRPDRRTGARFTGVPGGPYRPASTTSPISRSVTSPCPHRGITSEHSDNSRSSSPRRSPRRSTHSATA